MLFTYMTYSAYELYVALLDALISIAVALSVVVSLDRVFHVAKYMQLKVRSRLCFAHTKCASYLQSPPSLTCHWHAQTVLSCAVLKKPMSQ